MDWENIGIMDWGDIGIILAIIFTMLFYNFQGLLYLARQKRVLALKGNEKMDQFSGSTSPELRAERWRKLAGDGLKKLAQEARKVLHSHKFEKRQSAY